jgi:ribosomal-protein-alanine N-acetyltransferase
MQVRQFQIGDIDDILAIERESFGRDAWSKKLFMEYFRQYPELFLIVKLGGRTAGYSITCAGSRSAELASIAVDPRHRRRGVGQALLDFTLAELRARRVKTWWLMVDTMNESGRGFYERYGFVRTKIVKSYYGRGRDAWRMRLAV